MSDDEQTTDEQVDNDRTEHESAEDHENEDQQTDKRDDDAGLRVVDAGGDGRPVVLIHGWPLSMASWSGQVPKLTDAGYRVVTYDRRGFGQSDPGDGYDYDKLAGDLDNVLTDLDLTDVTLVGFSMGGGEVARYIATYGEERLHSVVFASAVPPYLHRTDDNPDGPLDDDTAAQLRKGLEDDRDAFFDDFMTQFFTAGGELKVSEQQRQEALDVCRQSDPEAALACLDAFATTDFRDDLTKITVPTLVLHGDSDATVPFEGSGKRTHEAIAGSKLVVIEDGPHGINVSHTLEFNNAVRNFLDEA
ncbi:alpha/beta fold hydrolase [Nocardioides cynanchi]|uniref:alpha/beta fold hydrolase n=1 Tax=Nocardioides cynanchi TaxID=2558918 RepID=UPI0012453925|nr:alpha/beta hydrolase [Nocardioides cynanchi]